MNTLGHVHPNLHQLFDGDVSKRTNYILSERFIPYKGASKVAKDVREVMGVDYSKRPKCILIYAEPGMGKSMLLESIACVYPPCRPSPESGRKHVFVHVSLESVTDLRQMYSRILTILGEPHSMDDKPASMQEQAREALKTAGTKVLAIDELHNLLQMRKMLEFHMAVLRDFANLPLCLLCAGTNVASSCIAADPQLKDRFRRYRLSAWGETMETRNFLATLESRLPLARPSDLSGSVMMPLILRLSRGHTGTMVTGLREAARDAVEDGSERIDEEGVSVAIGRVLTEQLEMTM